MLDEVVKTPVIFLVLDDENLSQVMNNILQVKDRGATVIVLTNLKDISTKVNLASIDHLIELFPQPSLLAAACCVPPLLMICYYVALMKGINPDDSVVEAINFNLSINS